jgi:hypothetical protein
MGDSLGCHDTEAEATAQMAAMMAGEMKAASDPAALGNLVVVKDKSGAYRWIGWVSNIYRDNDTPREIISSKAHGEYVAHVDATGEYPPLWIWHVPGSKVGQADWLDFADGFLVASGTFDKGFEDVAERIAKAEDQFTMSHGFTRLAYDAKAVVTDRYRMHEMSFLPAGPEANPWTLFTAREVEMGLTPEKKTKLTELLGEERVAQIEAGTKSLEEAAKAAGVDYKTIEDKPAEPPAEKVVVINNTATQAVDEKALSGFLEAQETRLKALEEKTFAQDALITEMAAALKAVKQSDDQKVADALTPKAVDWSPIWAKAASKSDATKLDEKKTEDQALKDRAPKMDFFANMIDSVAAGKAL